MPTNYPASLDDTTSLPRPNDETLMDDAGFEGDVIIDNLSDAVTAVETKVGTGASTPSAGKMLRGTAAGTSAWQNPPGSHGKIGSGYGIPGLGVVGLTTNALTAN